MTVIEVKKFWKNESSSADVIPLGLRRKSRIALHAPLPTEVKLRFSPISHYNAPYPGGRGMLNVRRCRDDADMVEIVLASFRGEVWQCPLPIPPRVLAAAS